MSAHVVEPEVLRLAPGRGVPQHPYWPVLLYRQVLPAHGEDLAPAFERRFAAHGWPAQWRAGVYPFHHYHAHCHEAFGIACGWARLVLGGAGGHELALGAGDVLVLPAGTAHCGVRASDDFLAVGAYPRDAAAVDMQREHAPVPAHLLAAIRAVPRPGADPAYGACGPLRRLWPHVDQAPA